MLYIRSHRSPVKILERCTITFILTPTLLPVHHHLLEFTQTRVHRVSDAIQPSHPLSSPSSPAPNPSQHQSPSLQLPLPHTERCPLETELPRSGVSYQLDKISLIITEPMPSLSDAKGHRPPDRYSIICLQPMLGIGNISER